MHAYKMTGTTMAQLTYTLLLVPEVHISGQQQISGQSAGCLSPAGRNQSSQLTVKKFVAVQKYARTPVNRGLTSYVAAVLSS